MCNRTRILVATVTILGGFTIGVTAQPPGRGQPSGSRTGNPTPGTPQPDPPNLADRITVSGCVQASRQSRDASAAAPVDPNGPTSSRYVLVQAKRENRLPPGTGTSDAAAKANSASYRLYAIDSQLSAFVGTRVEISGEVDAPAAEVGSGTPVDGPILRVEFIQKLAATCS
jgi:hypothetical protein